MTPDSMGSKQGVYSDYSAFVRLLETKARVRILDVLLSEPFSKFTAEELSERAGISKSSISRNKDLLIEFDVVKEIDGSKQKYTINMDSEITKILAKAHAELDKFTAKIVDNTRIHSEQYIGEIRESHAIQEGQEELADRDSDYADEAMQELMSE